MLYNEEESYINLNKLDFVKPAKKIEKEHEKTIEKLCNIDKLSKTDKLRITQDLAEIMKEYQERFGKE